MAILVLISWISRSQTLTLEIQSHERGGRRHMQRPYVGVPAESPDGSVADSVHGPLDL